MGRAGRGILAGKCAVWVHGPKTKRMDIEIEFALTTTGLYLYSGLAVCQ